MSEDKIKYVLGSISVPILDKLLENTVEELSNDNARKILQLFANHPYEFESSLFSIRHEEIVSGHKDPNTPPVISRKRISEFCGLWNIKNVPQFRISINLSYNAQVEKYELTFKLFHVETRERVLSFTEHIQLDNFNEINYTYSPVDMVEGAIMQITMVDGGMPLLKFQYHGVINLFNKIFNINNCMKNISLSSLNDKLVPYFSAQLFISLFTELFVFCTSYAPNYVAEHDPKYDRSIRTMNKYNFGPNGGNYTLIVDTVKDRDNLLTKLVDIDPSKIIIKAVIGLNDTHTLRRDNVIKTITALNNTTGLCCSVVILCADDDFHTNPLHIISKIKTDLII